MLVGGVGDSEVLWVWREQRSVYIILYYLTVWKISIVLYFFLTLLKVSVNALLLRFRVVGEVGRRRHSS